MHDAFGRPRLASWAVLDDGTAVVEAAQAIPLDPSRLEVRAASSRGLGELIAAVGTPRALVVGLGGTANMDAGAGLLEVLSARRRRVACDVRTKLLDAPALRAAEGRDRGRRARSLGALRGPSVRRAGGLGSRRRLGAALASLGAELVPGAELILELVGFDPSGYDLVVTGEGKVDETTWEGKAPAVVEPVPRCGRSLRHVRRAGACRRRGTAVRRSSEGLRGRRRARSSTGQGDGKLTAYARCWSKEAGESVCALAGRTLLRPMSSRPRCGQNEKDHHGEKGRTHETDHHDASHRRW